ncbi:MAG: hypothetical protein JRN10_02815 [Nitrososphaerota archaeon]|jgi:hypothetical protein|nr:hypothetical protein [Nitrososphaerota archaeon]MDG6930161.1 hypothetical protein [Nitrososphaerota archaeon]
MAVMIVFVAITTYFFSGVLLSKGSLAQQNWNLPLTPKAAAYCLSIYKYGWVFGGFGAASAEFGIPYFYLFLWVLESLGLTGGLIIKILAFLYVFASGEFAYLLARENKLSVTPSFLAGLTYMSSPILFDRIAAGAQDYLVGYTLLPLFLLLSERALTAKNLKKVLYYSLSDVLVLNAIIAQPSFLLIYIPLAFLLFLFYYNRRPIINGAILLSWLSVGSLPYVLINHFLGVGEVMSTLKSSIGAYIWQFIFEGSLLNTIRLWGTAYNFNFEGIYPMWLISFSFGTAALAVSSLLISRRGMTKLYALIYVMSIGITYLVYHNFSFFVLKIQLIGILFINLYVFPMVTAIAVAMLIGEFVEGLLDRLHNKKNLKHFALAVTLTLIVLADVPWFEGSITGVPRPNAIATQTFGAWGIAMPGPITLLNLAQVPSGYEDWPNAVNASNNYFVLYWPLISSSVGKIRLDWNTLYNGSYKGVAIMNGPVNAFNGLPSVYYIPAGLQNILNLTLNRKLTGVQIARELGYYGIKYIVIYKNTSSSAPMPYGQWYTLYNVLNNSPSFFKIMLNGVYVFVNTLALPIIHANTSYTEISMLSQTPANYIVKVKTNGPFLLTLEQNYSKYWLLCINGKVYNAKHLIINGTFNGWIVNKTGVFKIDITYVKNGIFYDLELLYVFFLFAIVVYLLVVPLLELWVKAKTTRELLPVK